MTGIFGGAKNRVNDTTPPATSLRVQTSVAGKPIPIIVGQPRLAPNLIDAQDFTSQTRNTGGGGGGGGKGLGGGGSCVGLEAPIATPRGDKPLGAIKIGDVIWSKNRVTGEDEPGIVEQILDHDMADSPDGMLAVYVSGALAPLPITTNHYPWIDGICRREMKDWNVGEELITRGGGRVAISGIKSVPKPARTRNLVVTPHHNFFAAGVLLHNGFGGGGGKGSTETDYFVAPVYGVCEGPISAFIQAWSGQTPQSFASLNMTGYLGGYPGDVSGYMASKHPANALPYPGLARVESTPMSLGTSPNLPNINLEMLAVINGAIAGLPDASPADWISDLTTNAYYGAGLPSARLGDLSLYSAFCIANGLVVSDALTDQRALSDYLKDLLEATYSEFVNVDGALTIIPRGMQSVAGNGATYTAPSVDYTLAVDDFLPNLNGAGGTSGSSALSRDPVLWSLKRRSDLDNQVTVNCLDRQNSYNPNPQTAQNLAAIEEFTLRTGDPKTYSFFMNASSALTSAHYLLEEAQIDKTCSFTLGMKYARVMPMSILAGVPLPANAGTTTVRVVEVTQNDDFTFSITAEEYPVAGIAPQVYNSENPNPNAPGINTDPGPVNAPIIFGAPVAISMNQGLEMWALVSGSNPELYGGCDVWGASDEAGPYSKLASLRGTSRTGVTTADFPVGADPDTVHALNVDISQSGGTLDGGTPADADQANTLCLVRGTHGDEFISYETAALGATSGLYSLGTYIRRGQFNTSIVDHPAGSTFGRLDQAVARIPYQAKQIGQTVWLKFLAFNKFGGGGQELGDGEVVAYPVVVPEPPPPPNVRNFGAAQSGSAVAFAWDQVSYPLVALGGYLLGYAPQGSTNWSDFKLLTESASGTEMTNADVPPGTWTFGIRAASIAYVPGIGSTVGLSPNITTFDLAVTNIDEIIYDNDEALTVQTVDSALPPVGGYWSGTKSGFVLHHTSKLLPDSQFPITHYTSGTPILSTVLGTSLFQDPVASSTYKTDTIDTALSSNQRVFSEITTALLPGQTGAAATVGFAIDDWVSGPDPNTFNTWTIAYATFRFLRGEISYSAAAGNISCIEGFSPKIDASPTTVTADSQAISPTGTVVTFPIQFHTVPEVVATPVGGTALYATVSNITTTDCTIHIWNSSGTQVGGTANYTATGE